MGWLRRGQGAFFASNRAGAQILITVSFSVTVNDPRITISNPSWPLPTVTKSRISRFIIHNAGISEEFFKFNQALRLASGWDPQPQHPPVYGQMTMDGGKDSGKKHTDRWEVDYGSTPPLFRRIYRFLTRFMQGGLPTGVFLFPIGYGAGRSGR